MLKQQIKKQQLKKYLKEWKQKMNNFKKRYMMSRMAKEASMELSDFWMML